MQPEPNLPSRHAFANVHRYSSTALISLGVRTLGSRGHLSPVPEEVRSSASSVANPASSSTLAPSSNLASKKKILMR